MLNNNYKNRGVSLYLSIVIITILLAVVLGLSAILAKQIKMIRGMENSVTAFYAAESGIEWILNFRANLQQQQANNCNESHPCFLSLPNSEKAEYYIEIKPKDAPNCSADNYCLISHGSYKDTARAIQVDY